MKLDNIRKLVRESWNPAVETFLDSFFNDEELPKEDQLSLLDGFEKGDAIDKKILKVYLRNKHLLEEPELKLIKLFEKGVEYAKEMLMKVVRSWIYRSSQLELAKLFHKRVKGTKKLLLTYFSPKHDEKKRGFCTGGLLELLKCLEEGVAGSQELLEAYIQNNELPEDCQTALVNLFHNRIKGAKEVLELYVLKYAKQWGLSKDVSTELVKCFKEGIDGAKDMLLTCVKSRGLAQKYQLDVAECFRNGVDGAKEILLSIPRDVTSDDCRYSKDVEAELLVCMAKGIAGAQEILEAQFPFSLSRLHEGPEHTFILLFTKGIVSKECFLKYVAERWICESSEKLLLEWFKKGNSEQKTRVLAYIEKDFAYGLKRETEKEFFGLLKDTSIDVMPALTAYVARRQRGWENIVKAYNEGMPGAHELLLTHFKRWAYRYSEGDRRYILNQIKSPQGLQEVREIFAKQKHEYYEL